MNIKSISQLQKEKSDILVGPAREVYNFACNFLTACYGLDFPEVHKYVDELRRLKSDYYEEIVSGALST